MRVNDFILKKGSLHVKVHNIEFSNKGIYLLQGENGSGKTSFIETILKKNHYLNIEDKQSNIAYFSQNLYRYPASGHEYIGNVNKELLEKYCEIFEVNYLNKFIENLSGGEFVKLSLIRALVKDTPILILDEPSNNLDDKSTGQLQSILNYLSMEKTIIVSTHDERLHLNSHTKYIIENGEMTQKVIKEPRNGKTEIATTKIVNKNKKMIKKIFFSTFNKWMFCF